MTFGSTLEARSSKLSAHAPPPLLFKWVDCCGWFSPWNYPFFRICSVLYAFFPLGFNVLFTISPFWDISPLSYSRELFLFLMSCAPHGLLSFTIVLVASLLGFPAENKRKRKEKGADLFFCFWKRRLSTSLLCGLIFPLSRAFFLLTPLGVLSKEGRV